MKKKGTKNKKYIDKNDIISQTKAVELACYPLDVIISAANLGCLRFSLVGGVYFFLRSEILKGDILTRAIVQQIKRREYL